MLISIIIPTLNEQDHIESLLKNLKNDPSFPLVREIIVVDGNSDDSTRDVAESNGVKVKISSKRSRSVQMNLGASQAQGKILYFLHADTYPPVGFAQKIWNSINDGYSGGCYRLRFDWQHWFLAANSWFTRFSSRMFRFGDQSLFVKSEVFSSIGGFDENMTVFEDQDIIKRLTHHERFIVLPYYVITSARKYRKNGPYKLQLVYFWIYLLYSLGFSQNFMLKAYRYMVPYPMV